MLCPAGVCQHIVYVDLIYICMGIIVDVYPGAFLLDSIVLRRRRSHGIVEKVPVGLFSTDRSHSPLGRRWRGLRFVYLPRRHVIYKSRAIIWCGTLRQAHDGYLDVQVAVLERDEIKIASMEGTKWRQARVRLLGEARLAGRGGYDNTRG